MSSFYARESKFRHVITSRVPREQDYESLRVSNAATDGDALTSNSAYLAYLERSAGAIAVLPLTSVGKNHVPVQAPTYQQPIIRAHSASVQDICFPGFSNQRHMLFSCASDSSLKLWEVPDGGFVVDCTTPIASFNSPCPLKSIACNPIAENIIATRGTRDVLVVDATDMSQFFSIGGDILGANDLQSLSWSGDGVSVRTMGKDKILRQFDIRASNTPSVEVAAHGGNRNGRVISLGSSPFFLSCGHSISQDREIAIWDTRNPAGFHC